MCARITGTGRVHKPAPQHSFDGNRERAPVTRYRGIRSRGLVRDDIRRIPCRARIARHEHCRVEPLARSVSKAATPNRVASFRRVVRKVIADLIGVAGQIAGDHHDSMVEASWSGIGNIDGVTRDCRIEWTVAKAGRGTVAS